MRALLFWIRVCASDAGVLAWAAALLSGISRLNRFDLTLDFADKATLGTLGELCDAIAAAGVAAVDVAALRAAYKL